MSAIIADGTGVQIVQPPKIRGKKKLADLVKSPNVALMLSEDERKAFGDWVVNGYVRDMSTRKEWEERNAKAIRLALQIKEEKSFPWTNASNVKFPLVTIGALQFLARISILTRGRYIAKYEAYGADPDGTKFKRAKRISLHTSMQLMHEDVAWKENDEQTKFGAALLGSSIKKTYFDSVQGTNISEYVPAMHFVVDYHCKHIDTTHRATHLIPMSENKIQERIARGIFIEEVNPATPQPSSVVTNLLELVKDQRQGLWSMGGTEEYRVLEQHCWFDFDGDGYAEPYVVSVREDTGHLYRIVARFFDDGDVHRKNDLLVRQYDNLAMQSQDAEVKSKYEKLAQAAQDDPDNIIVRIDPVKYFTKFTFVPSPDGGFYGLGLGALLGPVNEAVDTLINQLIDAGTMSNTAGGFMGRGVKLKGGKNSFDPFEWKVCDSTGDDLRKNIFPLPVREPSNVLFQLLGILITYGEKISSATDIMTGVSPGQNTPAETSRNTVEQGMMLFSGIYGRMYQSFTEELRKIYDLNRLYLHTSPRFFDLTEGPDAIIAPDDYTTGTMMVVPAADPSTVSGEQRRQKADRLAQAAASPLGAMWDKETVSRQWLEAHDYDVDVIYPDPQSGKVKPPVDPKIQMQQAELEFNKQKHVDDMQLKVAELRSVVALNEAKIAELQAKATFELAKADGEGMQQQIALLNAQIGAAREHNNAILAQIDTINKVQLAKSDVEQEHHQRLMDVHDRIQQRNAAQAAAKQENVNATAAK
jgi:chaperonin GroES